MVTPHAPDVHLTLARAAVAAAPVDDWATVFAALGDPNRLRILLAVHHAPGINVSALAAATGMTDNAASHALSALRLRGLVQVRRSGRERQWELCDDAVHDLLHRVGATHSPLHPEH
ncbi:ArsR/SmtB family transcription factor [Nakamurella deserti]|uniref:ArsR/SmtB family transcription factor n=1 Tax=Nakamurella deserti TaxID=2164074 RepID=UPI00147896BA|nr:metalloregulator ArsR/SmtB family transcription factor [Nakamurella deserti]